MILNKNIANRIKEAHQLLNNQGDLLTKSQIEVYCETFRQRFNPEKLNSMDGEFLLDTMHNHSNGDSLVYWLEFKNDEEFPTPRFGSIAGGSALKFGIYKRKDTSAWMTGSSMNQHELSIDDALKVAKKHREQFQIGLELLEELPTEASDAEYIKLQEAMNKYAPDVNDTAWGHKYFSLFYPEKLDDYHSPQYQRFHLIKLLQTPPMGEGRYICAGRYVAIAQELKLPITSLTRILNYMNRRPHRYWRIGTKLGGVDSRWELMKNNNCVAIGWNKIGDLTGISFQKKDKEKIRNTMKEMYPGVPTLIGQNTQQVFNFVAKMEEGDYVIPSDGMSILGIGIVEKDYFFEKNTDAPHRRHVQWLSLDKWKLPEREGLRTTVFELKKNKNLIGIEHHLYSVIKPAPPPVFDGIIGRINSVLERKSQVIIYGPPGTGKTYWAEKAACELASHSRYAKGFNDISADEQASILGKLNNSDHQVHMCTFHPAYGYEDFLEGYKPKTVNDQLVFELQDGIFKKICEKARQFPEYKYYLIIDEINRGDIPRIFGELLTILEKNKRGKTVALAVSGEQFYVPDNIYLIGTMNTADRSIALLDTALRRRFGFVELMPNANLFGNTTIESIPIGPWLEALNRNIIEHIGRDARNLQIGHAYLFENSQPIAGFNKFIRILQDDIFPLLEEYCYEDYATLAKILGKSIVNENEQRINSELFSTEKKDELLQALKSIDPNLDVTMQALLSEEENKEEEDLSNEDNEAVSEA